MFAETIEDEANSLNELREKLLSQKNIYLCNNKEFLLHYKGYYLKFILYEAILLFIEILFLKLETQNVNNPAIKKIFKKKILDLNSKYLNYININESIKPGVGGKQAPPKLYKQYLNTDDFNYIMNSKKFIDKIILKDNIDAPVYIDISENNLVFSITKNIDTTERYIRHIHTPGSLLSRLKGLFSPFGEKRLINLTSDTIQDTFVSFDALWKTLYGVGIYTLESGPALMGGACSDKCINNLHQIYDGTHDFEHLLSYNIGYLPGNTTTETGWEKAKEVFKMNKCDEPLFLHNVIYGLDEYKKQNAITPFDNINIYTEKEDESYKKDLENLRINYDEGHEHGFLTSTFELQKKGRDDNYFATILKLWDASSGGTLSKITTGSNNRYIHNIISIYCFVKYFKKEYDMKTYINYNGDNIPIILDIGSGKPKLCILSKNSPSSLNDEHFKLTESSGVLFIDNKNLSEPYFNDIFNDTNIQNLKIMYDYDIKQILSDYKITYNVDIPNLSVNTCTETIKHYLKDKQYYGKNRGKIDISNIIDNINNTINFLDELINDSPEPEPEIINKKIKLCYMLKHSGDTMQTYLPEICNSTLYTEDQMAIASSLINNNSVITCGKLITSLDLKKLWTKKKTKQALLTSLLKNNPPKSAKYLMTYNLKKFVIKEYIDKFLNTTCSKSIQFGSNYDNKCISLNEVIFDYYNVKGEIDNVKDYNDVNEYEALSNDEKIKRELLLKIITNNEKYKILQNLDIEIKLPKTSKNIKQNDKHILSERFLKNYNTKFAKKDLSKYRNPKENLDSYIIWCAYLMESSILTDEVKYNRFLHKHKFADLELFVSLFKTQIKIADDLIVTKNLQKISKFYTELSSLIVAINRSNDKNICPIHFLYLALKDVKEDINIFLPTNTDIYDNYKIILSNLCSELNLIKNIVFEFNNMCELINAKIKPSLRIPMIQ